MVKVVQRKFLEKEGVTRSSLRILESDGLPWIAPAEQGKVHSQGENARES